MERYPQRDPAALNAITYWNTGSPAFRWNNRTVQLLLAKGITVTADYQFLANPAYNAVRGPAHFFSGRLMAKF